MDLDFTLPAAVVAVVITICVAIGFIHQNNNDTTFRVACVQAGGTVGVERGAPTCVVPR